MTWFVRIFSFLAVCILSSGLASQAWPAGELDLSFGEGGSVLLEDFQDFTRADEVLLEIAPDGKPTAVIAPRTTPGGNATYAFVRVDEHGRPDFELGSDGILSPKPPKGKTGVIPEGFAIQPDGKLLVSGVCCGFGSLLFSADAFVARYNEDGSRDETFGSNGSLILSEDEVDPNLDIFSHISAAAIGIQSDGKIVIAIEGSPDNTQSEMRLARLDANGVLDPSFGTGGFSDRLQNHGSTLLRIQPDDSILIARGVHISFPTADGSLRRFHPDGTIDASFGSGGAVATVRARALALQDDGRILVGGPGRISRFDPNGDLDPTWGSGGTVFQSSFDLAVERDGSVLNRGIVFDPNDSGVVRLTSSGNLDLNYGPLSLPAFERIEAMSLQSDGRLVAITDIFDVTFHRFLSNCGDGSIDPTEDCDDGNIANFDCCNSACLFEAADAHCDADGDLCSTDTCDGAGTCQVGSFEPRDDCRAPTRPGKSKLTLKDSTDDQKDLFTWVWAKGEATERAALGDPTRAPLAPPFNVLERSTGYGVCAYDDAGLLVGLNVPPNGLCSGRDCWQAKGNPPGSKGMKYRDPLRLADGVDTLQIKPGDEGRPSAKVKARGSDIGVSGLLPLAEPVDVRVELRNDIGECWDARFSSAKKNTASSFSAKSD